MIEIIYFCITSFRIDFWLPIKWYTKNNTWGAINLPIYHPVHMRSGRLLASWSLSGPNQMLRNPEFISTGCEMPPVLYCVFVGDEKNNNKTNVPRRAYFLETRWWNLLWVWLLHLFDMTMLETKKDLLMRSFDLLMLLRALQRSKYVCPFDSNEFQAKVVGMH